MNAYYIALIITIYLTILLHLGGFLIFHIIKNNIIINKFK